jgi:glycosyltransferase involved in cell wall biosynthesis
MPALSLVIPCYDEAKNLPDLIARCAALAAREDMEIVLVDNGSRDETPRLLANLPQGLRSVRVDVNRGYGFGILAGLREVRADLIGWTHADLQTDPADALQALAIFRQNAGANIFVKGRRYGRPLADAALTFGMSCFESALFMAPFWDINAQPTLFPRRLFESWSDPPHDFALDLYAYWSARGQGYAIKRFAVPFGARGHGTQSRWNINWRSRLKMIARVLRYSWQLRRNAVK